MKNNNYKKYEKLSQDPNNQFDAVGQNNLYFILFCLTFSSNN